MRGKLSAEVCAVGAKMVTVRGGGKESSLGESGKKTGWDEGRNSRISRKGPG